MAATAVFVVATLVWIAYAWWLERDTYYWFDDWNLVVLYHDGNLLEPWNGHLSLVPALLYRFGLEVFGLDFTVQKVIGIVCYALMAVAVFVHLSRGSGRVVAAISGLWVLYFAFYEGEPIAPIFHNYSLPLALTVLAAIRLDRSKSDVGTMIVVAVSIATELGLVPRPGRCPGGRSQATSVGVSVSPGSVVAVEAGDAPSQLYVNRFFTLEIGAPELATLRPRESVVIDFPTDDVDVDWQVRATAGSHVEQC